MIDFLTENGIWIFLVGFGIFQILRIKFKWWMKTIYYESENGKCVICQLTTDEHNSSMFGACSKQLLEKRND